MSKILSWAKGGDAGASVRDGDDGPGVRGPGFDPDDAPLGAEIHRVLEQVGDRLVEQEPVPFDGEPLVRRATDGRQGAFDLVGQVLDVLLHIPLALQGLLHLPEGRAQIADFGSVQAGKFRPLNGEAKQTAKINR